MAVALATLRGTLVFVAMLTVPGWFMLTFGEAWRQWEGLQRWIVAVGLSIAFYPVLFYWMRLALPFWTWGPYKMGALLLGLALAVAWRPRGRWRDLFLFDRLEWAAIAVFGMTLFTRFWVIRGLPYPAWADSLHHSLLTQLTAIQGKLPTNMAPYFPVWLGEYHLGLYSLSATVEWLTQVPAHTALLWTAQVLNGLCGIGVYLVLDRKVGRAGAVVGAAVVGLFSHQPAFYVNWGRFTQLSSQAIVLIAWTVTWDAIALWRRWWQQRRGVVLWNAFLAALLTGAVFLLHFRVAAFYLPLLLMTVGWELWRATGEKRLGAAACGTVVVGTLALLAVAPAAWNAVLAFVTKQLSPPVVSESTARLVQRQYFEFPWETVPILVARPWLLVTAACCTGIGLLRRNRMVALALLWTIGLYFIGDAYRVGIPLLTLTNLGAVLIMLYLPIGLIVGSMVQEFVRLAGPLRRDAAARLVIALALSSGFVASHVRVTEIEPYRYFVTSEDISAMDWIRNNTASDTTFAVNTYLWVADSPHGTDGGYWIPYFTGRQTTAGMMLLSLATGEYRSHVKQMSVAAVRLTVDNSAIDELRSLGVGYIYIGTRGNFSGPGLSAATLSQAKDVTLVYQSGGVSIFQIQSPNK